MPGTGCEEKGGSHTNEQLKTQPSITVKKADNLSSKLAAQLWET